ncbi:ATP-binding protein [Lentzea terrae]|uniref:hypothetical protein n=1 Tax=Lentzea terrae TaxID=2200761 RepID=UPI000DD31A11|nr:hypothetical protein [Lentzea terrae]
MAARGETQANVEVGTLVVPAWRLRWRAPELALVLGERALALASARHDEAERLRAEALVVFAGNRVGRGVRIADRAIDALKAAEAAGEYETAWLLRVELAACARSVGAPLTGFAAVTPVLEAPDVPAELRASALVQASECLVTVGRGDEPTRALAEADQLYVADTTLDDDTRLLLRGLIRAVQAAQHRRWGDIAAAIGAAREGLDLLGRFADPLADSGQGMGRLTLELVLALMDANRLLDASEVGAPLLDRPVRAPSASTSGWLRLALATRVHLPAGRVVLAREMLRDAAASAERHQLDTLLAESLLALAHVHEVSGELADALTNLRSAHAAERRRARAVYAVRARLAAEFSGVHRQPADLHQQLASLLRPFDGMQMVADGVLSAALKQQLRTWRPVQVRKGDGLKVKRVRRAAEDMTVEGLSAARQHAADRWRMVQPFGEPDDKTPEPLEPPPSPVPSSDRTVPASGLIASAGAMVSGRRRAARVAAGEIDEDQPTTQPESPSPEPQPQQLTPDQERKRKVEEQLMELQREARRQIEAERQARADQRAQAEREAAEEAARQEAARQEAARQEAARQEAERQEAARLEAERQELARQELARQEAARQEAARQEAARQEAERQEAARQAAERDAAAREEAARREAAAREESARAQPESVLDMLKAQGLRAGGRRRAPDAESASETPSWRVEPPTHLRQDDEANTQEPQAPQTYFGAQGTPDYLPDPSTPDGPSRSGLSAAFARPPAAPDFGPHLDDPTPAYPLQTPAAGFPATRADTDERTLPERDYTALNFNTAQWSTASIPSPDPAEHPDPAQPTPNPEPDKERQPLPPIPDPVPSVPTPDEIPQPPEPDLLSSTFLSSADVEQEDDTSSLPTTPVQLNPPQDQPSTQPGSAAQPSFGTQTSFGTQPTFGTQTNFGTQPTFGTQTNFGTQPTFGTQAGFGAEPNPPADTSQPEQRPLPDPAGWANFEISPDFDVDPIVRMSTGPATEPDQPDLSISADPTAPAGAAADAGAGSATPADSIGSGSTMSADYDSGPGFGTGYGFGAAPAAGSDSATESDSAPQYDFFATEPEPATQPDAAAQFATPGTETSETDAATPTGAEQPAEANDEPGSRTGRPSSRRKPSDLSLADLLAEALVAYETGRRSDEEQFEAADLATQEWSTAEGARPDTADQPLPTQRPAEPERLSSPDPLFNPGQPFGAQQTPEPTAEVSSSTDSFLRVGESSPTGSDAGARSEVFGSPRATSEPEAKPSDSYFLPDQPFTPAQPAAEPSSPFGQEPLSPFGQDQPTPFGQEPSIPFGQDQPARTSAETPEERTGPIAPVGTAPDSETTGPIRPVRPDGPPGWTLPGV